jgi:putative ABC transport system substrate-binding protein
MVDLLPHSAHHPGMNRRRFLLTSLAGALAAPLAAEAQQAGKVYRIGKLWNTPNPRMEDVLRQSLRDLGWIEGQNFVLERRYSEGRDDRHPALAAELVRLQPDLIITAGTPAALAVMAATTTIPVVFGTVGDPVASGVVDSLARPGRNLTGTGSSGPELAGKWLALFKEAVPSLARVGVFINSAFSLHAAQRPHVEAAGRSLGLALTHVEVRIPEDVDGAFAAIAREKLGAVLVLAQPMWFVLRARLAKLALDQRVATLVPWREAVEAGALISYAWSGTCDALRTTPIASSGERSRRTYQSSNPPRSSRQGPRPHDPAVAAGAGGSADRLVKQRVFITDWPPPRLHPGITQEVAPNGISASISSIALPIASTRRGSLQAQAVAGIRARRARRTLVQGFRILQDLR